MKQLLSGILAGMLGMAMAFTLAHEMVQFKQYAKRELVVLNPQKMKWKGQMFINQRLVDINAFSVSLKLLFVFNPKNES